MLLKTVFASRHWPCTKTVRIGISDSTVTGMIPCSESSAAGDGTCTHGALIVLSSAPSERSLGRLGRSTRKKSGSVRESVRAR